MIQRVAIHLALVFLFALTQMGIATHEISHVTQAAKHSQQDKNTAAEHCEQCISYAKVASGLPLSAFNMPALTAGLTLIINHCVSDEADTPFAYAARGPPQKIST